MDDQIYQIGLVSEGSSIVELLEFLVNFLGQILREIELGEHLTVGGTDSSH